MEETRFYRISRDALKYRDYALARSCRDEHCVKPRMIILGDDGRYWLVTMADAEWLLRHGYEAA